MSRKKLIAGNWKMYKTAQEADDTISQIIKNYSGAQNSDVWIAQPFVYLQKAKEQYAASGIAFGAQNCYTKDEGAYTGEISAKMLRSIGCTFVILGHSERRQYFHETDELIYEKILSALQNNLEPVYCCGETLDERNAGNHFAIVQKQIETALFLLSQEQIQKVTVAYEPVWAIGTGVNATPEQAQQMHAHIRTLLSSKFGNTVAANIRILYGGSVKPANAKELFSQDDIDGGLVGGASLVAMDFLKIIEAAE